MTRLNFIAILLLHPFLALAQDYQTYEPSKEHPYGRPNPAAPEAVKDFAPMIGRCDCQSENRNPDGSWNEAIDMVWTFKYIMNGWGVQDETLKEDGGHSGSIRQYIADSARWYVHYYANKGPTTTLSTWEGNKTDEGDKIVLYRDQKAPNGFEGWYRLSFYDFTDTGFKWIGEWVDKAEKIVYPTWKIVCTRREE